MKKLILITLSIISLSIFAQEPEVDKIIIRENSRYQGQNSVPWREGVRYYDDIKKNWVSYNNRSNTALDDGREGRLRGINATGSLITNGQVVIISGDSDGIRTIALANAKHDSTAIGTIGFATEDISASDTGEVAIWGEINDLATNLISPASILYLDTVDGGWTTSTVNSPNWVVLLGNCGRSHATLGSINAKIEVRSNTSDVLKIFNGAILEAHNISTTSDGTSVYLKLSDSGLPYITLFLMQR